MPVVMPPTVPRLTAVSGPDPDFLKEFYAITLWCHEQIRISISISRRYSGHRDRPGGTRAGRGERNCHGWPKYPQQPSRGWQNWSVLLRLRHAAIIQRRWRDMAAGGGIATTGPVRCSP